MTTLRERISTLRLWLCVFINCWILYVTYWLYMRFLGRLDETALGKGYSRTQFHIRKVNSLDPNDTYRRYIRTHPKYKMLCKSFKRWLILHPKMLEEVRFLTEKAWLFHNSRMSDMVVWDFHNIITEYEPYLVCKLIGVPVIVWYFMLFDLINEGKLP